MSFIFMPVLTNQPETFLFDTSWPGNLIPETNPFFIEWLLCSDLTHREIEWNGQKVSQQIKDSFQKARIDLLEYINECPIIKNSITHYKLFKGELTSIEKDYTEILKIIELSFQVATVYWDLIKKYLTENSFRKTFHEVYFFKIIKPSFVSECDFLSLAYHALLFNKTIDQNEKFWDREKHRKEKLVQEHQEFFKYYLSGNSQNDNLWFTRTRKVDFTSHDQFVSSWFAVNRYEAFVESAILQSNKLKS